MANLTLANFQDANLHWANLIGANVRETKFAGAYLKAATMPDGTVQF